MLSKKNKYFVLIFSILLVLLIVFSATKKMANDVSLNENGLTPLMEVIENSNNAIAKIFISLGSSLSIKSSSGETPLYLAVFNNNEEIVRYILNRDKSTINTPNNNGSTPLEIALDFGFTSIAIELIKSDADVNCNPSSMTSVEFAISKEYYDIAKLLIEKGANINEGALSVAVQKNKVDIVKTLIEKGLKIKSGEELINAVKKNETDIVKLLIEKEGNIINHKDENGETALVFAIKEDNLDMAKLLIDNGAEVNNVSNSNAPTPLFNAESQPMVDLLISKGADSNYSNGNQTAKRFAQATINLKSGKYDTKRDTIPEPTIGMTADEVRNSTWGSPKDINRTTTKYGVSEQWVYNGYKYIYLEDGKVTAIQE